jgi:hypothetical protein
VLYDRELAGRVAAAGQARVLGHHLWREVVEEVLHIYAQVRAEFAPV